MRLNHSSVFFFFIAFLYSMFFMLTCLMRREELHKHGPKILGDPYIVHRNTNLDVPGLNRQKEKTSILKKGSGTLMEEIKRSSSIIMYLTYYVEFNEFLYAPDFSIWRSKSHLNYILYCSHWILWIFHLVIRLSCVLTVSINLSIFQIWWITK